MAAPSSTHTVYRNVAQPVLLLGVVSTERWAHARLVRLRAFYSHWTNGTVPAVLVRFILDERWLMRLAKQSPRSVMDDMLGVKIMSLPQRHCAHKMVGWWRAVSRWPADFYGKTDDDAAVDLARLVPLLLSPAMPRIGAYAGVTRYSSVNESSLEGLCWAPGAGGALKLRERKVECRGSHGPLPFVEGPLVIISADVQAWLAPRLGLDRRQLCHYEDLLLGRELSRHASLTLVNVDRLIGRSMVLADKRQGGGWVGATGLLAHHMRTEEDFWRAVAAFDHRAPASTTAMAGVGGLTAPAASLHCSMWRSSYADLSRFPCCHNWTLCTPPATVNRRVKQRSSRQRRMQDGRRHGLHATKRPAGRAKRRPVPSI